jgi:hypothetical protein
MEINKTNWDKPITCPYCNDDYTHIESVSEKNSDDYSAWSGRGCAARIAMYCEHCPNLFYVRVGEHKGRSYLGIETSDTLANLNKPE